MLSFAVYHRIVSDFDALPAIVAVHCVKPANDAGNLPGCGGHVRLQIGQVTDATFGVSVAPVGEGMNEHVGQIM